MPRGARGGKRLVHYVRYMDDIVLLARTRWHWGGLDGIVSRRGKEAGEALGYRFSAQSGWSSPVGLPAFHWSDMLVSRASRAPPRAFP